MSSAVFDARNDGISALTGKPFTKGTPCYFLTCQGNVALPARQIEASKKDTGFETGYRIVPNGTETTGYGRWRKTRTIFAWEQQVAGGRWIRVAVWSNMVPVEEAREAGFKVPGRTTTARKGKRTQGVEHVLDRASVAATPYADLTQPQVDQEPVTNPAPESNGVRMIDVDQAPTMEEVAAALAASFSGETVEVAPVDVSHIVARASKLDLD